MQGSDAHYTVCYALWCAAAMAVLALVMRSATTLGSARVEMSPRQSVCVMWCMVHGARKPIGGGGGGASLQKGREVVLWVDVVPVCSRYMGEGMGVRVRTTPSTEAAAPLGLFYQP
jgi:hypothetical protein